jgi:hypothetical protein
MRDEFAYKIVQFRVFNAILTGSGSDLFNMLSTNQKSHFFTLTFSVPVLDLFSKT